jgi:thiol-disulfide isomerase/thioredoxin
LFVELYAPWCHFCKELAPIWSELEQKVENDEVLKHKVKVVNIDADSQNDARTYFAVESFPTIVLYNGATEKFYKFKKERTIPNFLQFIKRFV